MSGHFLPRLVVSLLALFVFGSSHAESDAYATPVCHAASGDCFSFDPIEPNSTRGTTITAYIYSGFPWEARVPNPSISMNGSTVSVSGTFVHCTDCIDSNDPPPVPFTVVLPPLSAGTYSLELRLRPAPDYVPLPAVDTGHGLVVAGALMTRSFEVVAGTPGAKEEVVEYYDASSDHYFMTPLQNEIALLDARQPPFTNWVRTGFSFRAYVSASAPSDTTPICRFYNDSFGAGGSSHFYAAQGFGCTETLTYFPDWQLESPSLFNAGIPALDGKCLSGLVPLYRLYNNGGGGAPNHRFLVDQAERQRMISLGWTPEGNGDGVGMCVPAT